ncbi:hypothetical protein GCM10007157_21810 [Vreelandella hamiltonii]|uniref:Uncharacterized protein n=1 Tax=Vreelandella hamiltonii TaxID=502829 RepID=A0A8H9I3Y3_9GAMM|nr:hypothetical protein GCM10007157_21810 [Halomonas hamiltonii]
MVTAAIPVSEEVRSSGPAAAKAKEGKRVKQRAVNNQAARREECRAARALGGFMASGPGRVREYRHDNKHTNYVLQRSDCA